MSASRRSLMLMTALAPLLGIASYGRQQAPPLRRLGAPDVEFGEPFTAVTAIRELRDGRVLVADARDRVLQLVNLSAATATKVGREGAGPGEYGIPQSLVALPGDTTILYDPMNSRLLLILPDATPGPLLRVSEPDPSTQGPPRAADGRGNFYYELSRPVEPGGRYQASRVDVIRYGRKSPHPDTLATLQLPERLSTGAQQVGGGMLRRFTNKPFAPQDVAAFGSDGKVAIVRAKDYHVEWIGVDGATTRGPVIEYERIRITAAEREAFLASQTRPGNIIVRGPSGGSGTPGAGAPRAVPIPRDMGPIDMPVEWPDHKPPFLAGAAAMAPDGRLWVLKTRAHDDPIPIYDVFDGSGRLAERVALPPKTRLAGFGRGVAYLVRTDADDLLWLGRYRL